MRTLNLLLLIFSTIYLNAQSTSHTLPVTAATIYESGTTVTRSGPLQLINGMNHIRITGLPLDMDESTLSVYVGEKVMIQSQKVLREYIDTKKLSGRYDDLKQEITDSIDMINTFSEILRGEERILNENVDLSSSNNLFTAQEVSSLRANYAVEMKGVKDAQLKHKIELRRLNKRLQDIVRQMAEEGTTGSKGSAVLQLELQSELTGTTEIEIAYYYEAAGWVPTYDLRVDGLSKPLNIVYKASIYQNTGEDWKNVQLTLSTARPDNDYSLPNMDPYFLNFNNYYSAPVKQNFRPVSGLVRGRITDDTGEPLIGASVTVQGTTVGTITNQDGTYQIRVPEGSRYLEVSYIGFNTQTLPLDKRNISFALKYDQQMLEEVVVTGYSGAVSNMDAAEVLRGKASGLAERKSFESIPLSIVKAQTSINYDISSPLTIPSTNQEQSILIRNEEVPVTYQYNAYPKIEKNAYLIAQVINWAELQILYGVANIYIDNRYVGQTDIGEGQEEEEVYTLSLGQDRDVTVDRVLAKGYSKKKFVGNNRIDTRRWSLNVVNNKNEKITLTIEDQFPVSKIGDIKVDLKEKADAIVNEDTGALKWNIGLDGYGKKEILFEYEVKFPKDRNLIVD